MREKIKNMKLDITLTAVLSVVIGILFLVWPGQVTILFAKVIAGAVIITGVVLFIGRVTDIPMNVWGMVVSIVLILVGLWLFSSPGIIATVVPIAIGVLLLVHGIQDVVLAVEGRKNKASNWWIIVVMGMISAVCGVICICNAFGLVKVAMMLIGIMLIYDGLSDMIIVRKVNKAAKDIVDSDIIREEDVEDYM